VSLPVTRWTILAQLSVPEQRASALDALCTQYWKPVYAFLRGRGSGHEEAEDLTQGFFEMVVREGWFERADREAGKLRSFLLGSLENFAANAHRTRTALKRGAGVSSVPLHDTAADEELAALAATCATPEEAFDRAWLATLLQRAVQSLRQQYEDAGKGVLFSALLPWLLDESTESQTEAAANAGTSVANFRVQLHRLRIRYRDALQQEIAATLGESADGAEEMDHLFKVSRGCV